MEDYKFLFKVWHCVINIVVQCTFLQVVLVGNAGVGKTCIVRRFTQVSVPKGL